MFVITMRIGRKNLNYFKPECGPLYNFARVNGHRVKKMYGLFFRNFFIILNITLETIVFSGS